LEEAMSGSRVRRLCRRRSFEVGALLSAVALLTAAGETKSAEAVPATSHTYTIEGADISGVWMIQGYVSSERPTDEKITHTMEGEYPPLQPWADELYKKRQDDDRRGIAFQNTSAHCLPGGMPQMMISVPFPIQILQTPGLVTTLHEEFNVFRLIHLDQEHPDDLDPTYLGHSVGRWEGDTLVVDTVGRNDRTTIDMLGMPHSDQIRVVERIRLLNPDQLENVITVDDPVAFTRPWSMRRTYRRAPAGVYPAEYICLDGQLNQPTESGEATFPGIEGPLRGEPAAED